MSASNISVALLGWCGLSSLFLFSRSSIKDPNACTTTLVDYESLLQIRLPPAPAFHSQLDAFVPPALFAFVAAFPPIVGLKPPYIRTCSSHGSTFSMTVEDRYRSKAFQSAGIIVAGLRFTLEIPHRRRCTEVHSLNSFRKKRSRHPSTTTTLPTTRSPWPERPRNSRYSIVKQAIVRGISGQCA